MELEVIQEVDNFEIEVVKESGDFFVEFIEEEPATIVTIEVLEEVETIIPVSFENRIQQVEAHALQVQDNPHAVKADEIEDTIDFTLIFNNNLI